MDPPPPKRGTVTATVSASGDPERTNHDTNKNTAVASVQETNNTTNHNTNHIRQWAARALRHGRPGTAALYQSVVYTHTRAGGDAVRLARAHVANRTPESALTILQESGVLWPASSSLPPPPSQNHSQPQDGDNTLGAGAGAVTESVEWQALRWEACICACTALEQKADWPKILELVEDLCRPPPIGGGGGSSDGGSSDNYHHDNPTMDGSRSDAVPAAPSTHSSFAAVAQSGAAAAQFSSSLLPLDDHDLDGWRALREYITSVQAQYHAQQQQQQGAADNDADDGIHPLSLLCWHRGQAYHETGAEERAAHHWRLALRLDGRCHLAWECLLDRQLLTPAQAHLVCTREISFGPGQAWVRALYLAQIELVPQDNSSTTMATSTKSTTTSDTGTVTAVEDGAAPVTSSTTTPLPSMSLMEQHVMHTNTSLLDASSIPMSTPLPSFQTPGGLLRPTNTTTATRTTHQNNNKALPAQDPTQPKPLVSDIQYDVDEAFDELTHVHNLQDLPQVLAMAARRSYRRHDYHAALGYCQALAQTDPSLNQAAFCYICTLVVLGKTRVLFRVAHEWVDAYPKAPHAWFAVGAYYYSIQRYHVAQRHFSRATRLDPQCTPAWIAFGGSFAACDESDQALASFRAAQRTSPGEHVSLLYIGMEYVRTNHLVLARHFLQSARTASGGDPLALHELGVLALHEGKPGVAMDWFWAALTGVTKAQTAAAADAARRRGRPESSIAVVLDEPTDLHSLLEASHDPHWEPTVYNLGHAYRQTRQFDAAEACYRWCVAVRPPQVWSAYAALGYTLHLKAIDKDDTRNGEMDCNHDLGAAIEVYHQALSLKADDPLCTDLLQRALQDQLVVRDRHRPDTYNRNQKPSRESWGGIFDSSSKRHQGSVLKRTAHASISSDDMDMDGSFP